MGKIVIEELDELEEIGETENNYSWDNHTAPLSDPTIPMDNKQPIDLSPPILSHKKHPKKGINILPLGGASLISFVLLGGLSIAKPNIAPNCPNVSNSEVKVPISDKEKPTFITLLQNTKITPEYKTRKIRTLIEGGEDVTDEDIKAAKNLPQEDVYNNEILELLIDAQIDQAAKKANKTAQDAVQAQKNFNRLIEQKGKKIKINFSQRAEKESNSSGPQR
ncbi:MAG: hypothetical protein WCJ33_10200 [Pseudomonadota bacterium]